MKKNIYKKSKLNSNSLHPRFYILDSGHSGFTLVELLVAIGLFGVIVSIAIGGFVRALRTQRQVVALINANSNVSLVVEQIAREIRTGYGFCAEACIGDSLNFTDAKGNQVTYTFGQSLQGNYGVIYRNGTQMTADNVDIKYLTFTLLKDPNSTLPMDPNYPPRITINIGLSPAAAAQIVSQTNIQTTISARSFSGG